MVLMEEDYLQTDRTREKKVTVQKTQNLVVAAGPRARERVSSAKCYHLRLLPLHMPRIPPIHIEGRDTFPSTLM